MTPTAPHTPNKRKTGLPTPGIAIGHLAHNGEPDGGWVMTSLAGRRRCHQWEGGAEEQSIQASHIGPGRKQPPGCDPTGARNLPLGTVSNSHERIQAGQAL